MLTEVVYGFKNNTQNKPAGFFSSEYSAPTGSRSPTPFLPLPTKTRTPTPTITPTLTPTPTPTASPSPVPITIENLPEFAEVTGISGQAQLYLLDCEARSAVDWASFFGIPIDEQDFLDKLPKSDNPDQGFVGYYWDNPGSIPPLSYGIHAEPIAELLHSYGVPAVALKNIAWENIQLEIASGRPVVAWVIYQVGYRQAVTYTSSDGHSTIVAPNEHTVIVVGYEPGYVMLLDGNQKYSVPLDQFLQSWGVLGNMAIVYQD